MYPNKIRINNGEGQVSITAISRAFEVGQVAEDFDTDLNRAHGFSNCTIYYFVLYNKSLTPEEIETEKERLNEEWLKRKN